MHDRPYYSFRVGCLWDILVDAGEDKDVADAENEYGAAGKVCEEK